MKPWTLSRKLRLVLLYVNVCWLYARNVLFDRNPGRDQEWR